MNPFILAIFKRFGLIPIPVERTVVRPKSHGYRESDNHTVTDNGLSQSNYLTRNNQDNDYNF